jgi:hypothetical protein
MKANTIALATALVGAVAAAPLQERDTCTYNYQPTLWNIAQHVPETSLPGQTSVVDIHQDIGRDDLIVSFNNIPSNAWGCQLEFNFVPNANAFVWGQGDPQVINVYQLPAQLPAAPPTWNNIQPITGSLVGTWTFPTGDALNKPNKIFINSFNCNPTMNYRMAVANVDRVKGGIYDTVDGASGFTIAHNC